MIRVIGTTAIIYRGRVVPVGEIIQIDEEDLERFESLGFKELESEGQNSFNINNPPPDETMDIPENTGDIDGENSGDDGNLNSHEDENSEE